MDEKELGAEFQTTKFNPFDNRGTEAEQIFSSVMEAMYEKGYNPVSQLVGFLISGDPTYITSHKNARSLIMRIDRDTLLEEIVGYYIEHNHRVRRSKEQL